MQGVTKQSKQITQSDPAHRTTRFFCVRNCRKIRRYFASGRARWGVRLERGAWALRRSGSNAYSIVTYKMGMSGTLKLTSVYIQPINYDRMLVPQADNTKYTHVYYVDEPIDTFFGCILQLHRDIVVTANFTERPCAGDVLALPSYFPGFTRYTVWPVLAPCTLEGGGVDYVAGSNKTTCTSTFVEFPLFAEFTTAG